MDELLFVTCDSVGGTDGGEWVKAVVESAVGGLSVGVGRAESPLFNNALAGCDADLEDICVAQLY